MAVDKGGTEMRLAFESSYVQDLQNGPDNPISPTILTFVVWVVGF
jgi:hypothetical protein